jgi:hypothetical protein
MMSPVIKHLQNIVPELLLPVEQTTMNWTFDDQVERLGPDLYNKLLLLHPALNMEYSIACHQLNHCLSFPEQTNSNKIIEQLTATLMLAELLEPIYFYYLNVPREVVRLRRQQQRYRELLLEAGYHFSYKSLHKDELETGLSFSQKIRDNTANSNWYRLLITRSKRVLNVLELVGIGSEGFSNFVRLMDQYTNSFFAYLSWCFFIPRLSINLFLLLKHGIPGPWMDEKEKELEWLPRIQAQFQRRGFELVNDLVWTTVGCINCFVLIGGLSPFALYLSMAAFAFDMVNSSLRAYIELNRLFKLKNEYSLLLKNAASEEERNSIEEFQQFIRRRIDFEQLRLGLHVMSTICVFLAMTLALPIIAVNPLIPLISAVLLILIGITAHILTFVLEQQRPKDNVEKPSDLTQLGIFGKKYQSEHSLHPSSEQIETDSEVRSLQPS